MLNLLSYHDLGGDRPVESVLHAFVLGLIASLAEDYRIRSNREEGEGRADLVMSPFDRLQRGYVLEFKTIGEDARAEDALNEALAQIEQKQYASGLEAEGVSEVTKLAIVLQGKTITMKVA